MTSKIQCFPPGMMLLLKVHVILGIGIPVALQVNLSCSPLVKATSPGGSVNAGSTWTMRMTVCVSSPAALLAIQV